MEAATQTTQKPEGGKSPEPDPLEGGPDALGKAAEGGDDAKALSTREEQEALDFLLSSSEALPHKVPVTLLTDKGDRTIMWRVRQMDGREIDAIEERNRKGSGGPYAELDDLRVNAEMVANATLWPDVTSERFRTPAPTDTNPSPAPDADPTDAVLRVFRWQSGLLAGISGEIRRVSGWSADRVGKAQRVLVDAAGNS